MNKNVKWIMKIEKNKIIDDKNNGDDKKFKRNEMDYEGAKVMMEIIEKNEMDDEGAKVMMKIIKGTKWMMKERK